MTYDMKACGTRIQNLRKNRGLTQNQFAEKLNMSVSSIVKIEAGKHGVSIDTLLLMKDILQVSTDYLLLGDKPMVDYEQDIQQILDAANRLKKKFGNC